MGWKVFQMDMKSTFLNGCLEKEVHVEQLLNYIQQGHEEKVYKQLLEKGTLWVAVGTKSM